MEQISKEQIYQAYRTALDKYQKYRGRCTELARKYRELEKDNAKARQVLVETQDKALRRISELREQCQLEQQAKAHLESALRLEMDDLQCVVKTLRSKLELPGENSDHALNGPLSKDEILINLSSDNDTLKEQNDLVSKLETELKELRAKCDEESNKSSLNEETIAELNRQLETCEKEINELRLNEESNNILMAENKMMIHSELENKESEAKKLNERVATLEVSGSATFLELNTIKEQFSKAAYDLEIMTSDKLKLEDRLKEVFEEKKAVNSELKKMKYKNEKDNEKFKELLDEKNSLQSQNEQLHADVSKCQNEITELQLQKMLQTEEIRSIGIASKSSESEAIKSLQESMKSSIVQLEKQISSTATDLNKIIKEKSDEILRLTAVNTELSKKLSQLELQRNTIADERDMSKSKIESLKNEKRDFEKTLDREIREKNELKAQVTNILQEIGRLEEQLKEVRTSHSSIQAEKQRLEEKIERIQKQHHDAKSKLENDQNHKWQSKLKELEIKLHEVECENSQLAEKNCLLEENTRRTHDELKRLQSNLTDSQEMIREENSRLIESSREMEERIKTLNDQLTQCTGDHEKLYDEKEQLDHQYRSLQDANETKEKEKLCLIEDISTLQQDLNSTKAKVSQLQVEKSNLTECCDNLRLVVDNIKTENEAMIRTRDEMQKSFDNMKSEFDKLNSNKISLEEQMTSIKDENKNLTGKNHTLIAELKLTSEQSQIRLTELQSLLKHSNDAKQSLTESLHKQIEDALNKAEEEKSRLAEKLTTSENSLSEFMRIASEKKSELKSLQDLELAMSTSNQDLNIVNRDLMAKVNSLENEINRFQDYQNVKDEKLKLENELKTVRNTKACLENQLKAFDDYQQLKEEKSLLELKIKLIEEKNSKLESRLMALDDYESLRNDNSDLLNKQTELTSNIDDLESKLKLFDNYERIKQENLALVSQNNDLENTLKISSETVDGLKAHLKSFDDYELIKIEKSSLENQLKELQEKSVNYDVIESMKNHEIAELNKRILELQQKFESSSEDRLRMEKEIESSHSIIKDLNSDFDTLQAEKASLVKEIESHNVKIETMDKELTTVRSSSKLSLSDKYETLIAENNKLQESNLELLEKLENLEKSSNGKISDLTQEIEEMQENARHYIKISTEFNALKTRYEQTDKERANDYRSEDDSLKSVTAERDELENKLKRIMHDVEDVSNKNIFLEQKVENYLILEQSNERLRLTNEKLSRQLDETLVSCKLFN